MPLMSSGVTYSNTVIDMNSGQGNTIFLSGIRTRRNLTGDAKQENAIAENGERYIVLTVKISSYGLIQREWKLQS